MKNKEISRAWEVFSHPHQYELVMENGEYYHGFCEEKTTQSACKPFGISPKKVKTIVWRNA